MSSSSFFSSYAPFAGYMFMLESMRNNFIPYQVQEFIKKHLTSCISHLLDPKSNHLTFLVKASCQCDDYDGQKKEDLLYEAAELYLSTKLNPKTKLFRISKLLKKKGVKIAVAADQEILDTFEDIEVKWSMTFSSSTDSNLHVYHSNPEKASIELTFHRKCKNKVIDRYIPYVLLEAQDIKDADKDLKLYSYDVINNSPYQDHPSKELSPRNRIIDSSGSWSCVDLEHPATFDTLAMEPELKTMIIKDLDKFVKRREFYKRVGKAWKRGYLLFGPPGTGKSSLIAAMANHLHFDIYDLELTSISSNDQLRKAMMATTNRSIIVFEDIDCNKESVNRESTEMKNYMQMFSNSESKFTLSGLLNIIDGLGSSSGDERIIVFTTNHKERLDPALLRPGRMDMHIYMSYCTPEGFKTLASNYLGIQDTSKNIRCREVEALMGSTNITPAEVCEELMRGGGDDADEALEGLVNCLKRKRRDESCKMEEEGMGKAKKQKPDDNAT